MVLQRIVEFVLGLLVIAMILITFLHLKMSQFEYGCQMYSTQIGYLQIPQTVRPEHNHLPCRHLRVDHSLEPRALLLIKYQNLHLKLSCRR